MATKKKPTTYRVTAEILGADVWLKGKLFTAEDLPVGADIDRLVTLGVVEVVDDTSDVQPETPHE